MRGDEYAIMVGDAVHRRIAPSPFHSEGEQLQAMVPQWFFARRGYIRQKITPRPGALHHSQVLLRILYFAALRVSVIENEN
jgi:hypothetical protein